MGGAQVIGRGSTVLRPYVYPSSQVKFLAHAVVGHGTAYAMKWNALANGGSQQQQGQGPQKGPQQGPAQPIQVNACGRTPWWVPHIVCTSISQSEIPHSCFPLFQSTFAPSFDGLVGCVGALVLMSGRITRLEDFSNFSFKLLQLVTFRIESLINWSKNHQRHPPRTVWALWAMTTSHSTYCRSLNFSEILTSTTGDMTSYKCLKKQSRYKYTHIMK